MKSPVNRRFRSLRLLAAAAVLGIGGAALADALRTVWTAKPEVRVLDGKGARFNTIITVPKGVPMQVMAEEGPWLRVQFTDKDAKPYAGWVFKGNTSNDEVDGGDLASAFGMGGGQSSGMDSSLAGKGVAEEVKNFANAKNLDPAPADRMIAVSRSITPAELEAFDREGKVGSFAK